MGTPPTFMPVDCSFHSARNSSTCFLVNTNSVLSVPDGRLMLVKNRACWLLMELLALTAYAAAVSGVSPTNGERGVCNFTCHTKRAGMARLASNGQPSPSRG